MALRRNVLIFHQAALGDFIVTWPLAVALGRAFPQSRVMYVTSGQKGKLAEQTLRVESIDVESGFHHLFAQGAQPPANVIKLLDGAHTIITFCSNGRDAWAENVRRLAPTAQIVPLDTKPDPAMVLAQSSAAAAAPPSLEGHVTAMLLRQLASWPVLQLAMQQILVWIQGRGLAYGRPPADAVVIHPGGGKAEKCWPAQRFAELVIRLKAHDSRRPVRVLLGEVEKEKWSPAQLDALRQLADVREPATLLDLLKEIALASVFIGNDSGPGHLAGIIGVPTLSLFGPADPTRWKPLGPRVTTLRSPSMDDLTVDQVKAAALGNQQPPAEPVV